MQVLRTIFILVAILSIFIGILVFKSKRDISDQRVNCVYELYDLAHKEKRDLIVHNNPIKWCESSLSSDKQVYYKIVNIEPVTPEPTDLEKRLKEIDDESSALRRKSRNP
jgi:hypothetical protein